MRSLAEECSIGSRAEMMDEESSLAEEFSTGSLAGMMDMEV
jgi:hypothetical protein